MFHRSPPYFLTGCLLLFIGVLLPGCDTGRAEPEGYHHLVKAIRLQLQPSYTIDRHFVGRVEARQRSELGFEVGGSIEQLTVDEGQQVVSGQLLARLDDSLLLSEIKVMEAEREELQAKKHLATLDIKRQRELNNKGYAVKQRLDELQAEFAALQARLKRQQALLVSAHRRLEKHAIHAPFSGEVTLRYRDNGAVVNAGQPLFQLLEKSVPEARVGIPARLAEQVNAGQQVEVHVAGQALTATVLSVGGSVDAITQTVMLRLALPVDGLADGEILYLALSEQVHEVGFWIPQEALSAGVRGMWNVYALKGVGEQPLWLIEARSVQLLHMANGQAFVNGAVSADEQVVAAGLHRVAPGLAVRVASGVQP